MSLSRARRCFKPLCSNGEFACALWEFSVVRRWATYDMTCVLQKWTYHSCCLFWWCLDTGTDCVATHRAMKVGVFLFFFVKMIGYPLSVLCGCMLFCIHSIAVGLRSSQRCLWLRWNKTKDKKCCLVTCSFVSHFLLVHLFLFVTLSSYRLFWSVWERGERQRCFFSLRFAIKDGCYEL